MRSPAASLALAAVSLLSLVAAAVAFLRACRGPALLACQRAYLTRAQRARLRAVERGDVTRRQVEIVMSRYMEDVSWSDAYAPLRTVYDKFPLGWRAPRNGTVHLPNVGRESYAYLRHIVDNYDRLADLTVFTQAGAPTYGYVGGHPSAYNGHMSPGFTFHDFVLAQTDGFVIFNHNMRLDTFYHVVQPVGFRWKRLLGLDVSAGPVVCPIDTHQPYWAGPQSPVFLEKVYRLCAEQGGADLCVADVFWRQFVRLTPPRADEPYHWVQGARYAVTRQQLQRRPRYDYEVLLSLVSAHEDPWAGYFLEWFFYPILTSDARPPCRH